MTPRAFLDGMVKPNVADFHARYDDMRCAFNAVASIDALAAHIFVWVKNNSPAMIAEQSDSSYREKLAASHGGFRLLRDIAKAQKHVHLRRGNPTVTRASQVSSREIAYGEGPYGMGRYGGPPQVVVDMDDGSRLYLENVADDALGFLEAEMVRVGIPYDDCP